MKNGLCYGTDAVVKIVLCYGTDAAVKIVLCYGTDAAVKIVSICKTQPLSILTPYSTYSDSTVAAL